MNIFCIFAAEIIHLLKTVENMKVGIPTAINNN